MPLFLASIVPFLFVIPELFGSLSFGFTQFAPIFIVRGRGTIGVPNFLVISKDCSSILNDSVKLFPIILVIAIILNAQRRTIGSIRGVYSCVAARFPTHFIVSEC
jgi:hypothetical protein